MQMMIVVIASLGKNSCCLEEKQNRKLPAVGVMLTYLCYGTIVITIQKKLYKFISMISCKAHALLLVP
jgi:hypothetical protein